MPEETPRYNLEKAQEEAAKLQEIAKEIAGSDDPETSHYVKAEREFEREAKEQTQQGLTPKQKKGAKEFLSCLRHWRCSITLRFLDRMRV